MKLLTPEIAENIRRVRKEILEHFFSAFLRLVSRSGGAALLAHSVKMMYWPCSPTQGMSAGDRGCDVGLGQQGGFG